MVVMASSISVGCQLNHFHNNTQMLNLATFLPITSSKCRIMKHDEFGRLSTKPNKTISAIAADTTSPTSKDETSNNKYYFVVANAKFMLDEEEHFKELMFERLRLFQERSMDQDFWLVVEPMFLHHFPNITKRLKRPAVALVSTNRPWITYMKLRLDRVLSESYEADTIQQALASNPVKLEFDKPDNWVAPYQKYEYGWWETFLPPGSQNPQASTSTPETSTI